MDRIIRIQIPKELKDQFKEDRHFLEEKKLTGKAMAIDIEKYLADNNIIKVLKEVNSATSYSSYGYVKEAGFYKNFPEWLDFAVEQIMSAYGIDVSTPLKKRDAYLALGCSQTQLELTDKAKAYDREYLIDEAEYFTHKPKAGANYNPQIRDMCTVFIDIGLETIHPTEIIDISYTAYQQSKTSPKVFKKKIDGNN